jgi:hypothetical protein
MSRQFAGAVFCLGGVTLAISGANLHAATYEVGPGKTYATIQAAVNAAKLADTSNASNSDYSGLVGGVAGGAPLPSSVNIVIYGGTYTEQVIIPFDPAGQKIQTKNDNWTLQSAPGETVWLNGGIEVGHGRDYGFIKGINIYQVEPDNPPAPGTRNKAFQFTSQDPFQGGNTGRGWTVSDLVIHGDQTAVGYEGYLQYGSTKFDHVTIYNMYAGVGNGYAAGTDFNNSIVANSLLYDISSGDSYNPSIDTQAHDSVIGAYDPNNDGAEGVHVLDYDAVVLNNAVGNPLFVSTDPNSAGFLRLDQDSPAANRATTAGLFTDGGFHSGARGIVLNGNTDFDGDVDLSDLSNLAANYGAPSGATWAMGDFDQDGDVDLSDLSAMAANYGSGEAQAFADFQSITGVPEPTTALFAGLGVFAAISARRRS